MPQRDTHTLVHEYPLARRGINLYTNIVELLPDEALTCQNLTFKNGMKKRGGGAKFETDEVQAGKKITGLHRFYYSTASKQLLVASGTVTRYHDGATWQNIETGLTDGSQVYWETWLGSAYRANTDDAPTKWDGSSSSAVAAAPADAKQFLGYQDRLLSIEGGDLSWSASFDDATWETVSATGVRPDTQLFGMTIHSQNNSDAGYEATVLLAGANGMYLFKGTDLRTPSTTGNYTIYPLATKVGCNAPRTMQWTPKGTIYLGIDRQVYLLPFESSTPIPIGDKIRSNIGGVEGVEKIPAAQISNACAVYHDGYYKLSFTPSGGAINDTQFWLDVNRMFQDESGFAGPWYGPMIGENISVFAIQAGNGDDGQLMAGEADATVGSFVYEVGQNDVFSDSGTAIQIYYETFYNPLGSTSLNKSIHRMEAELLDVLGTVNINFKDITGSLKTGDSFGLSGNAIYWDDAYWNDEYWSSSAPTRQVVEISPAINTRRLLLSIDHSSDDDTFELYALRVKATEENLEFEP
jgi:hypothetical protein